MRGVCGPFQLGMMTVTVGGGLRRLDGSVSDECTDAAPHAGLGGSVRIHELLEPRNPLPLELLP